MSPNKCYLTLEVKVHHGQLGVDVSAGGEADQTEVAVVGESVLRQAQLQGGLRVEEISQPMIRHLQTVQLQQENETNREEKIPHRVCSKLLTGEHLSALHSTYTCKARDPLPTQVKGHWLRLF